MADNKHTWNGYAYIKEEPSSMDCGDMSTIGINTLGSHCMVCGKRWNTPDNHIYSLCEEHNHCPECKERFLEYYQKEDKFIVRCLNCLHRFEFIKTKEDIK